MKKNLLKGMALSLILALSLTFVGCGSKDEDDSSSRRDSKTTTSDDKESKKSSEDASEPESSVPSSGDNKTTTPLEEMLADPSTQALADAMSGNGFKVELSSENGTLLIFRFILEEQLDLSDEDVKDVLVASLEAGLDTQDATFQSQLNDLRTALEMDDLTMRIVYLNADGTEIAARTYE